MSRDPLLRAVVIIGRRLSPRRCVDPLNDALTALEVQHDLVQQAWRKMSKAHRRGWHTAASHMRIDLLYQARRLQSCVDALLRNDHPLPIQQPAPRQLFEELRQLEEEFEAVQFLPDNKLLITVTTQPIELEGIGLVPPQSSIDRFIQVFWLPLV
jgi:hypothetical protein